MELPEVVDSCDIEFTVSACGMWLLVEPVGMPFRVWESETPPSFLGTVSVLANENAKTKFSAQEIPCVVFEDAAHPSQACVYECWLTKWENSIYFS